MTRSRYPSLQIPGGVASDLRQFLESVKERLEITTGDRGDPRDRLLTVRDVEDAGMATVTVRNKFATLSGGATAESVASLLSSSGAAGTFDGVLVSSLDALAPSQIEDALDFIGYNNTVSRLQRVPYQSLRALFLTEDSDAEVTGNWQFQNEDLPIEITAESPRLRFTETGEVDAVPADGAVWDWVIDDQLMSLLLVSDDEADSTAMLELSRDGLDPSFFALVNGTILQIQDGTLADPGLAFDDDLDTGVHRIAANRIGVDAGAVLALDITGTQVLVPTGSAGAPGLAFHGDADTGPFRAAANEYGIATNAVERLRVNATGIQVAGTAVLTAVTGHLDVTPSAAANFAALKVRDNAGTEIWRLNSETDGDLDFARQSGTGLLRLNAVALIDAALFTTGTLDDARLSSNVPLKNTANVFTAANTFNLTPTVPDQSWTYAKIQNVSATSRVLGRVTAGAGVIEELTGADIGTLVGYTAADVLTKLLTVDGAGSGLDADLLDGLSSAAFLQTSTYEALTPTWANLHTFSSNILLTSANPRLRVLETGLAADTGAYDFSWDGGTLALRTRTDADGAGLPVLTITRPSGTQPLRLFTGGVDADLLGFSTTAGNINNFTVVFSSFDITRNANFALASTQRPLFNMLKYGGTFATPTQITNNTALASFSFSCYNTDTAAIATTVDITTTSTENWGASAQGTRMDLRTTPNGSTTRTINIRLAESQVQLLDGTAAAPSLTYQSDLDCGLYRIAANQLGISCNATLVVDISTGTFAVTATTVRLNTTTATTVGAAGAAAALPANPLGYISANIGGTAVKIPYYNN